MIAHQDRGDPQAAPAALGEPEVPAGEVAGDDVRDAEAGQQDPTRGALLELALLVVVAPDVLASAASALSPPPPSQLLS